MPGKCKGGNQNDSVSFYFINYRFKYKIGLPIEYGGYLVYLLFGRRDRASPQRVHTRLMEQEKQREL